MREHGHPIVCLPANSDNTGFILCSKIIHFPSYMAAFLVDHQGLFRLCYHSSCSVFFLYLWLLSDPSVSFPAIFPTVQWDFRIATISPKKSNNCTRVCLSLADGETYWQLRDLRLQDQSHVNTQCADELWIQLLNAVAGRVYLQPRGDWPVEREIFFSNFLLKDPLTGIIEVQSPNCPYLSPYPWTRNIMPTFPKMLCALGGGRPH